MYLSLLKVDFLFVLPVIFFIIYCVIASFTKLIDDVEVSKVKRVYYLLFLIWFLCVSLKYYNEILLFGFTPHMGLSKEIWNYLALTIGFFIFIILWEWLFLFPKAISEFSFGNVKFTYKDKKNIDDYTKVTDLTLNTYKKINEVEHIILCEMKEYVFECMALDKEPDMMYISLLEKYNIYQDGKLVYFRFNNDDGMRDIQKCLCLNDGKFEEIIDKVYRDKYYIFKHNDRECLITVLEAGFSDEGIIIALTDTIILKEEYDILGHIIKVFDLELDSLIKEDTIDALTDTIDMLQNVEK